MAEKIQNRCSFCNKTQSETGLMVRSDGSDNLEGPVFICRQCLTAAAQVVESLATQKKGSSVIVDKIPTPKEVVKYLDQYVVGQDYAKRSLSVAVVNHYKRLISQKMFDSNSEFGEVEIDKSNVLVIGPTGCGKTALARHLAEIIQVPFAIGDATAITQAGYVGEDVETLLLKLVQAADGDVERAQNGILFIDEIDKISASRGNVSITRDVSGEGVQQSLLKIIEGTVANLPPQGGRKHPETQYIQFDTSNVLFICGGTFTGLDDIIARRLGKKRIGFLSESAEEIEEEKSALIAKVTPEDLHEFGMIPEFVGRLPVITPIDQLTEETLKKILTDPKNAILKQYQKLFAMDGVKLKFTPEAIDEIAKQAKSLNTGARALRGVVEQFILPLMYDLPELGQNEVCIIDIDVVRQKGKATIIKEAA